MQMPPTRSISRASTVAKIGRPMKKLTMAVLPTVALRVGPSIGGARPGGPTGRGSGLPVRPLRGLAFLGLGLLGLALWRPGPARRRGSRRARPARP